MINSIELENWKTHGSTKLNFSKGTNLLIGNMGAGKSSIMDAISFGLFGTFPSIQQRRSNVGRLIRSKPIQQNNALVRIEFTNDNDTYVVERRISLNGPSSAKIEKNGAYLQSQPERVTEEIVKVLKVDYDLFSKAIYSEQNGLDYFLDLRAADRKKQIDGFLGLDKFVNAYENVTALINKVKDIVHENERIAEGLDISLFKEQLESLAKESEQLSKELNESNSRMERLKSEKHKAEDELKSAKEKYNRKIAINNEITEQKSRTETLLMEIEKIDSKKIGKRDEIEAQLSRAAKELEEIIAMDKKADDRERASQNNLVKAQTELSRTEKDLLDRNKLKDEFDKADASELKEKLEMHRKEEEELLKEIALCRNGIKEKDKAVGELKRHIAKCPVCDRDLSEEMKKNLLSRNTGEIKELEKRASEAEKESSKKKIAIEHSNNEIKRLTLIEEKLKGYAGIDPKLKHLREEIEILKTETSKLRNEGAKLKEELLNLREKFSLIKTEKESAERRDGYVNERKKIEQLLEAKKAELSKLDVDEKKVEALQNVFSEKSTLMSKLESDIDSNKRYAKDKQAQMKEKKDQIARVDKIYEDIAKKKAIIEDMAKFKSSLEETQTILRDRLVSSVNEIMAEIWPELYPYADYTGIMLDANEDDYTLKVRSLVGNQEIWDEVEAIASGGERSTACLAMRIALALVLVPNLKWLILDEPTHNIDQQGLDKFIGMFNETLPRIIDQIFIITHDETLKQVSNAKIYLLNRNKGEHEETSVVEL